MPEPVVFSLIITPIKEGPMTKNDAALSTTPGTETSLPGASAAQGEAGRLFADSQAVTRLPHISFVLYDGMTALDLIGPAEVLAGAQFRVDYVWRSKDPVRAESQADKELRLLPTATFADISETDILCVPGTSDPYKQMLQKDMLEWLAAVGRNATWVTSVCTGSFLLGAAGLLKGYRATTHWTLLDQLSYFGAIPENARVVHDRNRVTGAGVTSGIDFGLTLLSLIAGQEAAAAKQLVLEYDPAPPFSSGSPAVASPELTASVKAQYTAHIKEKMPYAQTCLEDAALRLGVI